MTLCEHRKLIYLSLTCISNRVLSKIFLLKSNTPNPLAGHITSMAEFHSFRNYFMIALNRLGRSWLPVKLITPGWQ